MEEVQSKKGLDSARVRAYEKGVVNAGGKIINRLILKPPAAAALQRLLSGASVNATLNRILIEADPLAMPKDA